MDAFRKVLEEPLLRKKKEPLYVGLGREKGQSRLLSKDNPRYEREKEKRRKSTFEREVVPGCRHNKTHRPSRLQDEKGKGTREPWPHRSWKGENRGLVRVLTDVVAESIESIERKKARKGADPLFPSAEKREAPVAPISSGNRLR